MELLLFLFCFFIFSVDGAEEVHIILCEWIKRFASKNYIKAAVTKSYSGGVGGPKHDFYTVLVHANYRFISCIFRFRLSFEFYISRLLNSMPATQFWLASGIPATTYTFDSLLITRVHRGTIRNTTTDPMKNVLEWLSGRTYLFPRIILKQPFWAVQEPFSWQQTPNCCKLQP